MRSQIFLLVCLSLIACAWGNNLFLGRRLLGDQLVLETPVLKPPVPGISQTATIKATAPPGHVISFISVVNLNPKVVGVRLIKGFIGTPSVVILAAGRPGWGLVLKATVFAVPDLRPTSSTPEPTSTQPTTTPTAWTTISTEPTTTTTESTSTSTEPTTTPTESTSTSTEPTTTPTESTTTSTESTTTSTEPTTTSTESTSSSWTELTSSSWTDSNSSSWTESNSTNWSTLPAQPTEATQW